MKITIIDGSPAFYSNQDYTLELATKLIEKGHQVFLIKASKMKINFCQGCWSCWWKTPGVCPQKDDMEEIYRSYMKSDIVIHFSPLMAGFISSSLKTINDRSVPLVLPYVTIVQDECHHKSRYEKYPFFGLILDYNESDDEDVNITRKLYERLTLNLKTDLKIFETTNRPMEEIANEISNI
jgi:multimeric flavodoxin WrbA